MSKKKGLDDEGMDFKLENELEGKEEPVDNSTPKEGKGGRDANTIKGQQQKMNHLNIIKEIQKQA